MGSNVQWIPFSDAFSVNPKTILKRGYSYPFIEMAELGNSRDLYPEAFRPYEGGGARFASGDTLLARITPCLENGKIGRYIGVEDYPVAFGSTEFIVVRGIPSISDGLYGYYVTKWDVVHNYLVAQMTGTSGRQRVPVDAMKHIQVPLPSIQIQQAIAVILGSLDDKIELNRQINENLEGIAQALFKSWFIDFDPVRAKAEGRDTGLPEHISSLFPASFKDSELGQIPDGWSSTRLTDQFDVVKGTSYLSEDLCSSDFTSTALVTLKSIGRQGGYREEGLKPYKGRYKNSQELVSGDVVISCTDVTQQAEVIGRAAVVCSHPSYRHLVASLDLVKLICKKDTISPLFVYLLSKTEDYVSHMLSFTTGTTVLHLDKTAFKNLKFVIPPQIVMAVFNREVDSIFRRINLTAEHNGILKKVRDTLLPKLISGELPIPDAERIVGRYL